MRKSFLIPFLLAAPCLGASAPATLTLSLSGLAAQAYANQPLDPSQGLGVEGAVEARLSGFLALGLDGGMVEFIAPTGQSDMKTAWLDLEGRFFPLPASRLGEAYLQAGFGFSPYVTGLFGDYWPNYASDQLGQGGANPAGGIYWNAEASLGYRFTLGPDWGLDLGMRYDLSWPPASDPLQTLGLRAGMAWSFGLPAAR